MPNRGRVEAFIARVERGDYVGAIEDYYAEHATMQDNDGPVRGGREALVAHEKIVMAAMPKIATRPVERWLVDGDRVAINWVFDFTFPDGRTGVLDEIALQEWEGDRIVRERFYFDPAWRPA
ncbi:nuclear transport factor 2 family protein [Phenylobacterium montanum]|uniref:Nuclear transport factor 2 family protein n=1 Tax=Phenylobacterium montanum TaxID=2823693 RepID=A0A975G2H8_9CAUL|nr:nuclear transport factor 2 family protein [Caulobacter sp. S6]QUD89930.1 nuclear transport factor 2 family protein [Caulobacter sp. S6]